MQGITVIDLQFFPNIGEEMWKNIKLEPRNLYYERFPTDFEQVSKSSRFVL